MDVHGKIREVLSESLKDDLGYGPHTFSEGDFLQALQRRGIIDDVMRDLQFSQVTHQWDNLFVAYALAYETRIRDTCRLFELIMHSL